MKVDWKKESQLVKALRKDARRMRESGPLDSQLSWYAAEEIMRLRERVSYMATVCESMYEIGVEALGPPK